MDQSTQLLLCNVFTLLLFTMALATDFTIVYKLNSKQAYLNEKQCDFIFEIALKFSWSLRYKAYKITMQVMILSEFKKNIRFKVCMMSNNIIENFVSF